MSREENNQSMDREKGKTPETAAGQSNPKAHTNDPGSFSQRGEHVNRDPNEPVGGLGNDRDTEKDSDRSKKGDSTQAGTQNSSSAGSESGAGSGNLTAENRANRTSKFGPEHNSNTSGF